MDKKILLDELKFCLNIWEEKGGCNFGGFTKCDKCATPYLLSKLITGEVLHDENMQRLTLENWEDKVRLYEN